MPSTVLERLRTSPVIVAVRDAAELPRALSSPHPVVFLLAAEISSVVDMVYTLRSKGKDVFVHFDLVAGLGKDAPALRWLADMAEPTGIITTRTPLVGQAKGLGLATVQRTFLVDSQSVHTAVDQVKKTVPDFLEVMPGIAPDGIRLLVGHTGCPVIAGGLIRTREQVRAALDAGALAISTNCEELWGYDPLA